MPDCALERGYGRIDHDRSYILICQFIEEQGMIELIDGQSGEFYFGNIETECSLEYYFGTDGTLTVLAFMGPPSHADSLESGFRGNYEKIQYLNDFSELDSLLRGLAGFRI